MHERTKYDFIQVYVLRKIDDAMVYVLTNKLVCCKLVHASEIGALGSVMNNNNVFNALTVFIKCNMTIVCPFLIILNLIWCLIGAFLYP